MLILPGSPEFQKVLWSHNSQPSQSFGFQFTPGNLSFPAYAEVMASSLITDEAWGIYININSSNTTANARDLIVKLGIDYAGGSSWVDWIPPLLAPCANSMLGLGIGYFFPIRVPAGCSIAVSASVNNATVSTGRIFIALLCKPKNPELHWRGQKVIAYGVDLVNFKGTDVTNGTTSEGTAVQLGTLADRVGYWEFGVGINNASMVSATLFADILLGDATNKRLAIENGLFVTGSAESAAKAPALWGYAKGAVGDNVYGRVQTQTTQTGLTMAAYGVTE